MKKKAKTAYYDLVKDLSTKDLYSARVEHERRRENLAAQHVEHRASRVLLDEHTRTTAKMIEMNNAEIDALDTAIDIRTTF